MKIVKLELIEIKLPLVHFFETSFGRTYERRIILTRLADEEGNEGWGECTVGESPSYSEEWTDAAWVTIEKVLAPMVLGKDIEKASQIWGLMKKVRGNRMAKAAIETAVWDLEAKKSGAPLWKHLGGVSGEIECGVSIGIQDSVEQLFEKIQTELDAGYRRIKIKIKPGWDIDVIKRVREKFGDIRLMGDANSAYSLDDVELFQQMDEFHLMMFEQPLAHDDMYDHARLQKKIETPICLDESIHSLPDARKAIKLGACRIINIKLGRVGGHKQAKRLSKYCHSRGVPVWCGGMLETGIGRAHNIAMSTLEGFTLPGDVSASKRYWHEDIIEPAVEVTLRGTIVAPEGPGIGFEIKRDRIDKITTRSITLQ
ncbi:MAG TPA: o-succinylbenzoate synthase [Pyrinomonadaceae bacterium]|jgi:O-succinylbenzoate synthase|nr:o-succinylbenzoate synthase [Pyrinomonadaceae bacterium]